MSPATIDRTAANPFARLRFGAAQSDPNAMNGNATKAQTETVNANRIATNPNNDGAINAGRT